MLGDLEQLLRCGGEAASAAAVDHAKGLAAPGIQEKEGLGLLGGQLVAAGAALNHVAFGVADQAVRVQDKELAGEVAAGAAQLAQGDLELEKLVDGVRLEQVVEGAVGRQPRQAISQLEALVAEGTIGAQGWATERRLMDHVQAHARGQERIGPFSQRGPQEVPGAQAQVLGQQEPNAQQQPADLIGQELADAALDAQSVGGLGANGFCGALGGQGRRGVLGVQSIQFFFEGRSRR